MSAEPPAPPYLSVVVPAYNEEARLPQTLASIGRFLATLPYRTELVVVDDGSTDATVERALRCRPRGATYRVIGQPHRGKASAVRVGVLAARGQNILFTDADLSTPIEAVLLLMREIERGADVAIGSREGAAARRLDEPFYRHLMGRAFNLVVQGLVVPGIDDTQCGFKLFTRTAAGVIFPALRLHQSGTPLRGPRVSAFDVEVLFLARKFGLTVAEVPVTWTHVPGSKVRPALDSFRMLFDVLQVRVNALLGKYNVRASRENEAPKGRRTGAG